MWPALTGSFPRVVALADLVNQKKELASIARFAFHPDLSSGSLNRVVLVKIFAH
jgi:hypothetical protein